MPNFATSCLAALAVSWTAQQITPEVLVCLPLIENAFEDYCRVSAPGGLAESPAPSTGPRAVKPPPEALPAKSSAGACECPSCEEPSLPPPTEYVYYYCAFAAFAGAVGICMLRGSSRAVCHRPCVASVHVQTDFVITPLSSGQSSVRSHAALTPRSPMSSSSAPGSPSRDKRRQGVYGGFYAGR